MTFATLDAARSADPASVSHPSSTFRVAAFTLCLTYVGIVTGGAVTSTETGMADEHAPLFDGGWVPDFGEMLRDPGLLLEHGHRIIMGFVGVFALLCAVAACVAPGSRRAADTEAPGRPRTWVRALGVVVFLLVLPPAVFGALTVHSQLHPALSVTHVSLAMLFISGVTVLTVVTGKGWYDESVRVDPSKLGGLAPLAVFTLISVYVQILLGAIPRHATGDVGGSTLVAIGNAVHIVWAFVVFAIGIVLAGRIVGSLSRVQRLLRPAALLLLLFAMQVFLGFGAFITQPKDPAKVVVEAGGLVAKGGHVWLASIHQAAGVLILVVSWVLVLRIFRLRRSSSVARPGGAVA